VEGTEAFTQEAVTQDSLYKEATEMYGLSLDRLARAYELDADARRDLLQEIHLHLWRSFASFDLRCSLRTWVYRVAHNVAAGYVMRQRRTRSRLVSMDEIETLPGDNRAELAANQTEALERLSTLIQRLKPLDRNVIVSYLEGLDAKSIGEVWQKQPTEEFKMSADQMRRRAQQFQKQIQASRVVLDSDGVVSISRFWADFIDGSRNLAAHWTVAAEPLGSLRCNPGLSMGLAQEAGVGCRCGKFLRVLPKGA